MEYGVFVPSNIKPLKVFSCKNKAEDFAKKGVSREVFKLDFMNCEDLQKFFIDHASFVIECKVQSLLYKRELH